jgi:ABC-type polysaccharide/polyol phosphate export permease
MLTLRDIKLRYKQTLLGITWVVLQPLLSALLFTGIFRHAMSIPDEGSSYLLFTFSALNVPCRDLKHIVPFGIQLASMMPQIYQNLYQMNPLVGIVQLYRYLLADVI